jgi:hypothetical protein
MIALPPRAALFPRAASPLQAATYPQAATGFAEMLDRARASAAAVRGHPAQSRACPFQAAQAFQDAARAHLVLQVASAQQEPALPLEESAAWGGALVLQQVAAAWGAVEARQQVAVARAWVGEEAVRQREARDAAAVPLRGAVLRAVPDAQAVEPRAAGPLEVPWVFRRDQALPWPAPQPAVRFARAMQSLQIALP